MVSLRRLVITGGAGFIGSNLAIQLRERLPHVQIIAVDNLRRRGSELSLPRLRDAGVDFRHVDVRCPEDFRELPAFDALIECSALTSVQAGATGSPREVIETNLVGSLNCLEAAREVDAAFLFLSTSRVYPIEAINGIPFGEVDDRFVWDGKAEIPGWSQHGIGEDFGLHGPRSFYGTSKLSSELLVEEYCHSYGMRGIINRCGLIAGPWQMGKVDQGVVTLWVARHHFGQGLRYIGFGGAGKQVRDVLHIDDLVDLVARQLGTVGEKQADIYNVGGGVANSVSLKELTALCESATGQRIEIVPQEETHPLDVRIYISDSRKVEDEFDWRPKRSVSQTVEETAAWVKDNERELRRILNG